jgi:hypothetical protein
LRPCEVEGFAIELSLDRRSRKERKAFTKPARLKICAGFLFPATSSRVKLRCPDKGSIPIHAYGYGDSMRGFREIRETLPSLVTHTLGEGHEMSNQCWCRPFLHHIDSGARTMVMHNNSMAGGLTNWPLSSQR